MLKILLIAACVFLYTPVFSQQNINTSLAELNQTIQEAPGFDSLKTAEIRKITAGLPVVHHSADRFVIYLQLYEAYKAFRYDSAYNYARKLQETALLLNDPILQQQAKLKLCFSLTSAGLFKDASDSLSSIQLPLLPDSLKTEYYLLMGRLCYDMADFGNDNYYTPLYIAEGNRNIDAALQLIPAGSFEAGYYDGLKNIRVGNNEKALQIYRSLTKKPGLTDHEIALTTSTLSDIFIQKHLYDSAIALLIEATIADIKSSTKETAAAFNLATLLYKQGNVKDASTCIQLAISDAASYGARQRKVRITEILPLIESEKLSLVKNQEKTWITYAVIVTCLLIGVIMLIGIVLRQVKKLKAAQQLITQAHLKEQEINHRLLEANNIKEEYIGYFFNTKSEFFDKVERFKKHLEQKVKDRRFDEIKTLANNMDLKAEKNYLLLDFDRIFLKLFPHFKDEFNALFLPDNQIELKEGELMNTDLRIFALIRLGIHETEKIAPILQYSVNTINTYKTKIKNKSMVPNEEFEKRIMIIKAV
jgi:tetratricopeptide (TPR) repeat protein